MGHVQPRESIYNEQVRVEIQRYFQALDSYPERFSQDPNITFKKHLHSLVGARQISPRGRS